MTAAAAGGSQDGAAAPQREQRTDWLSPVNVAIAVTALVALILRAYLLVRPGVLTVTQYDDGPVLAKNADLGMRSEDFAIGIGPTLFEAGIVSSTHDLRVLILYHPKN